jgi:hypothetical protein
MQKIDAPIIEELGSVEGDDLYRVTRDFYIMIKAGPPSPVMAGDIVRLTRATARMFFPAKILPVGLSDPGRYEVIQDFKMPDESGLWIELHTGDILELTFKEGLPLMRNFQIKPIKIGGNEK